jgi:hypothetical protein
MPNIMTIAAGQDQSFAIVTPTYLPDLVRCELLARSLDRCAPDVPHYLIVDNRDLAAFRHLEGGNRRLIVSESLVGHWLKRLPGKKSYWLSFRAPPVRGWIIQQILKIAAVDAVSERTLIFCDSDTSFFRHFDRTDLLVDGKIGLLDIDFTNDDIHRWTEAGKRLLGLSGQIAKRGHVGNMICWNRETILAMRRRIAETTGSDWQVALARTPSFSEYMLYGMYVREVAGYRAVDHAPSDVPLVKASWGEDLGSGAAIDRFFSNFDPRTVAVMVHSKDGINPNRFEAKLEQLWGSLPLEQA